MPGFVKDVGKSIAYLYGLFLFSLLALTLVGEVFFTGKVVYYPSLEEGFSSLIMMAFLWGVVTCLSLTIGAYAIWERRRMLLLIPWSILAIFVPLFLHPRIVLPLLKISLYSAMIGLLGCLLLVDWHILPYKISLFSRELPKLMRKPLYLRSIAVILLVSYFAFLLWKGLIQKPGLEISELSQGIDLPAPLFYWILLAVVIVNFALLYIRSLLPLYLWGILQFCGFCSFWWLMYYKIVLYAVALGLCSAIFVCEEMKMWNTGFKFGENRAKGVPLHFVLFLFLLSGVAMSLWSFEIILWGLLFPALAGFIYSLGESSILPLPRLTRQAPI